MIDLAVLMASVVMGVWYWRDGSNLIGLFGFWVSMVGFLIPFNPGVYFTVFGIIIQFHTLISSFIGFWRSRRKENDE